MFGSGDITDFRHQGAFVSVGTWDDEGKLEAALTEVHTLVFIPHGLAAPASASHAAARVAARAATQAGVQRVLMVSALGAADSTEPYRESLHAAEQALSAVPAQTLILRTNLVATPRLIDAVLTGDLDAVSDVDVAPVSMRDIAALVAAYDQARSDRNDGTLVVRCDGATTLPLGVYREQVRAGVGGGGRLGRKVLQSEEMAALRRFIAAGFRDDVADVDGFTLAGLRPTANG